MSPSEVNELLQAIENLENPAPIFLTLWASLMARKCSSCYSYGVMLCTRHKEAAKKIGIQ